MNVGRFVSLALEIKIASILIDVEAELRHLNCWDDIPPPDIALQSEQPFCIDTLEFYQWLQWVFIPRVRWMLDEKVDLPKNCNIAPMAEGWIKSRALIASDLIRVLRQADQLLSAPAG